MTEAGPVREMRPVVTATDYDDAVRFYRDVLGMPMRADGAVVIAEATRTPWDSLNARLSAPAGLQLTLFQELARD